jgi:hypothetical protein
MATLHQLNVRFDAEQDRLILTVRSSDESEYLFWLTRRFTRLLVSVLEGRDPAQQSQQVGGAASSGQTPALAAEEAMREFNREAAIANSDFTTAYQPSEEAHRPLGDEPLLASEIQYTPMQPEQNGETGGLQLHIRTSDKRGVNVVLDQNLRFAFVKLLEDSSNTADWNLNQPASPANISYSAIPAGVVRH